MQVLFEVSPYSDERQVFTHCLVEVSKKVGVLQERQFDEVGPSHVLQLELHYKH